MNQLVIRYHRVSIQIEDQVAVTHVDQIFFNPNDWSVEGIYYFPLPIDAAVSDFTLWVDGKPVEGKILDKDEARIQYQEIVNKLRDPALLEYVDQGAFRAHIFPIMPQDERRIELTYSQVLSADNGLVRYTYPLNTEKFSAWPLEQVSISVDIRSADPIRAIYSPSHAIDINRESDMHVLAGYEDKNVLPDADFTLLYSLGDSQALHLTTYRDPSESDQDGYFMLMLAPPIEQPINNTSKDVILVLDRSGSMEGEKFNQAQEALRYILEHLKSSDRFNVLAFSTGLQSYASELRPASESTQAQRWIDGLSAQGSTDINRALLEAVSIIDPENPTYLIFLTDGLPTEGVIETEQILENLRSASPENLRMFAFGVGYDVDTFLLDSLAGEHHGKSTYVVPGERIDEILSSFYEKISTPVMTDLSLDFGNVSVYDLYPSPLPDLFHGTQIILVGRYREGGKTDITLNGQIGNQEKSFRYADQIFESSTENPTGNSNSTIPRLWATRKIGHLLNQIRLKGVDQETVEQIVNLSIRYGIVTPYTSYLVTEPHALGEQAQERIVSEQYDLLQSKNAAPTSGQSAVEEAIEQSSIAEADAPSPPTMADQQQVRVIGSRTFIPTENIDGIDKTWVDTAFDPEKMQTVKVEFLSPEYYSLAEKYPTLADAFSLGPNIIALVNGVAYQVVPQVEDSTEIDTSNQNTTETPAANLPIINKSGNSQTQNNPPASEEKVPPLPCIGGLLVLAVFPLSLLFRIRSNLRGLR